jgi:hypothetical protein
MSSGFADATWRSLAVLLPCCCARMSLQVAMTWRKLGRCPRLLKKALRATWFSVAIFGKDYYFPLAVVGHVRRVRDRHVAVSAVFSLLSQLRRRDRSASKAPDERADCLCHRCEPPGRRRPFSYLKKAGPSKKARGLEGVSPGLGLSAPKIRLAGSQREARRGPCRFCT